jgi:hypothetical protein
MCLTAVTVRRQPDKGSFTVCWPVLGSKLSIMGKRYTRLERGHRALSNDGSPVNLALVVIEIWDKQWEKRNTNWPRIETVSQDLKRVTQQGPRNRR